MHPLCCWAGLNTSINFGSAGEEVEQVKQQLVLVQHVQQDVQLVQQLVQRDVELRENRADLKPGPVDVPGLPRPDQMNYALLGRNLSSQS